MNRHDSTRSRGSTGFDLEQVRFERIFDAPSRTGTFSFEADGKRQFGVDLLDSEVPHEGSHYAFVLAEPGNWQTLLGWRDLSTSRVVVRDTLRQLAPHIVWMAYAIVPLVMVLAWRLFGGWAVPVVAALAVCAGLAFARTLLRRHRTIERILCEVPPAAPPGSGRERTQSWRQRFVSLLPFRF
jgi:hypothetical protein